MECCLLASFLWDYLSRYSIKSSIYTSRSQRNIGKKGIRPHKSHIFPQELLEFSPDFEEKNEQKKQLLHFHRNFPGEKNSKSRTFSEKNPVRRLDFSHFLGSWRSRKQKEDCFAQTYLLVIIIPWNIVKSIFKVLQVPRKIIKAWGRICHHNVDLIKKSISSSIWVLFRSRSCVASLHVITFYFHPKMTLVKK